MTDITTPVSLDRLDDDHAIFAGTNEEILKRAIPFVGEIEIDARYPTVWMQRSYWEAIGRPVEFMLRLSDPIEARE